MSLRLFNYLSRSVEEFKPAGKTVGLYTCGPTVYDYVHIGNWRTFVFEDILKRVLVFNGHDVKHVMNLTDIDDKIIKKAQDQKVDYAEITNKYSDAFKADLSKLNIIPADVYPRATDKKYMDKMIDLIQKLMDKGVAYKGDDGIYFSVEKFPNYGKLSGLDKKNLKKGARVNSDEYDKDSWMDFALWKFKREDEPSWKAPFGEGRPGWHIECSAMSMEELGESFDIHTGGVDLLFPHHENEIAQSEAATGKKFVDVWMEGEHLLVDSAKMAKRDKNIFTLKDLEAKGIEPLALRYLFLTAHYRSKLNFTWESLQSAQNALDNLRQKVSELSILENIGVCVETEDDFANAINDDLDLPKAIAILWEVIKDEEFSGEDRLATVLKFDQVLGLGLSEIDPAELPKGAKALIEKREELRSEGKYAEADKYREKMKEMGVEVEDTPDGPVWKLNPTKTQESK